MRRKLALSLIAVALTGCSGLASVPLPGGMAYSDNGQYLSPQPGPGLVAKVHPLIPDVPTPIGFKPLVSRSYNHSTATARNLKYWYQGQAQEAEVQWFYQQQLPAHGWHLLSQQNAPDGSLVLRYDKGGEALRVRLAQIHVVTTIVITITPKQPTVRALP